jgi:hypothetical protein
MKREEYKDINIDNTEHERDGFGQGQLRRTDSL